MKKSFKKLHLKKEVISKLKSSKIQGGYDDTETIPVFICQSVRACETEVNCPTQGATLCYTHCDVCC